MILIGIDRVSLVNSSKVVQKVDLALTHGEQDLYRTKWFDYRFDENGPVHPLQATLLFADAYIHALRDYNARRNDVREASFKVGLDSYDLMECKKSQIASIWRARQHADKHGVKYDFWCFQSMKYAEIFNWKGLPRPNQLYSQNSKASKKDKFTSMVDFIVEAWKTKLEEEVVHAESPFYRISGVNRLHPYQVQHVRYLLHKLKTSKNRVHLLAYLLFEKELLLPKLITEVFGDEEGASLLRRAAKLAA